MTWNHRVLYHAPTDKNPDEWFAIHEVYYDENGKPTMCTKEPVEPFGESLDELKEDMQWFLAALDKPVLNFEDF